MTFQEQAQRAKEASRALATMNRARKDAALLAMAEAVAAAEACILSANAQDVEDGRKAGLTDSLVDRLRLTPARIAGMVDGLRQLAGLADPVGDV
ncbi:MAG: gamma-glutamyl-phosphate reductase, partial [Propionibacteriaceae bacterium]